MSEMTGLERLRELGREQEERSWSTVGKVRGRLMLQIAEQIEDERFREQLAVERVASEMELHCLGVEGMEDSPVARWARELREALGGRDEEVTDVATIRKDAYDAYEWVCEHGGLERVKWLLEWCLSHDSKIEQLDFDYWLSGRVMHELGFDGDMADRDEVERRLADRLMPEGMEWLIEAWPRFEDGEPVRIGDEISWKGDGGKVNSIELQDGGYFILHAADGAEDWILPQYFPGERVKRPALKVLDADGVEIREGDTVWDKAGVECEAVKTYEDTRQVAVKWRRDGGGESYAVIGAHTLTHRAPVIAADGRPLREGETVWGTGREEHEYVVLGQPGLGGGAGRFKVACHDVTDDVDCDCDPDQLTHERPGSKCRDCAHWQKDPTADNMGVCWFYYHEYEGQDCYAARLADIGACEEFMPRVKPLAGDA